MSDWLDRLAVRVGVRCAHTLRWDSALWRPADWAGQPCRVCRLCDRKEQITAGEFFALFGIAWADRSARPATSIFR
jgi:hypothetical protein